MLGALVVLTAFGGPVTDYLHSVAAQIFDTSGYIDAVLGNNAVAQLGQ